MKYAILFPGYGAQYVGMGKELYDTQRVVQERFEEAADCMQINFVKLMFASSDAELSTTTNGALSLFILGASTAGIAQEQGDEIALSAGIDLPGYMSALYMAKSINFPDGLYLIKKWAELYEAHLQETGAHGATVRVTESGLSTSLMTFIEQMAHRGEQIAVSRICDDRFELKGDPECIARYTELTTQHAEHITITPHTLGTGFYAPLREDVAATLWQYLEKIDIHAPQIPVVDPFDGAEITTAERIRATLRELLIRPFRVDCLRAKLMSQETIHLGLPSQQLTGTLTVDIALPHLTPFIVKPKDHEENSVQTEDHNPQGTV